MIKPSMKQISMLVVASAAVLYVMYYVGSRKYLESFRVGQAAPTANLFATGDVAATGSIAVAQPGESKAVDLVPVEVPYTKTPINNADDYEYNLVYQNESDKPLQKGLRDKLMSQYPMDWSGYPPSSSQFQAGLRESFENAKPSVPDDAKPYKNIAGSLMQPPDKSSIERQEQKILQTYRPKFPPTPTTYDARDAQELIKQIYDAKGLIPEVRHKEGTNVYEIIGTRGKNEKVKFEDEEATATDGPNSDAMESHATPNMTANDKRARSSDAFFNGRDQAGGKNSWNYTSWTPGLERMFAPNEPREQWF